MQDANRLIRQSDEFAQYADILSPFFRTLQSYRLRNLVESYQAFEKAAKYVFLIFEWIYIRIGFYLLIPRDFSAFIQEFRNWESSWALEALYVIAYEIRVLAERVRFVLFEQRLLSIYAIYVEQAELCLFGI